MQSGKMTNHSSLKDKVFPKLTSVIRPARYIGGELNMTRKAPDGGDVSICLAFPDIYDIGQSYIGFHILYHILNTIDGVRCERTFAPWPDMESVMRTEDIPLWSLENFLPVSSFDIVGFTLQYELHYTAVLNMLDLAGIALDADNRAESDPFVIGGGTCCVNPEPVAQFFDAFLLGDGEEAFPEIAAEIASCRADGVSRKETLVRLAGIEGVYVPSLYHPDHDDSGRPAELTALDDAAPLPVRSRIVERLRSRHYPDRPLVPLTEVVHDRLAIEVMRGCSHGCRFCGAGMSYRPKRVRPVDDVVRQAVGGIASTGWDEIGLVSLSTTDWPGLETAVRRIGSELGDRAVSISLSSLRADNFSLDMAEATAGGKKTGLTFAVEAGSQRLRDVINKNLTEEQLFETIETALGRGFGAIKLYFMIGHPTETDEDVEEIARLLTRIGGLVKKHGGRRVNVTINPFCPKPSTPFQWEAQDSAASLARKLDLVKKNLRTRAVNIRDTQMTASLLEGRLSRGGRGMSKIIREAWKRGARLDGWSEHFDGELWRELFAETGIDLDAGMQAMDPGEPLPWDHLFFGVNRSYLVEERERAIRGETTSDCAENCHACGPYAPFCAFHGDTAAVKDAGPLASRSRTQDSRYGRRRKTVNAPAPPMILDSRRLRIKYTKEGPTRFTSHLDMIRIFGRTLRRAGIPVAYTQGFHPHPKLSFGYPLPLGFSSFAEYVDITLEKPASGMEALLEKGFPEGMESVAIRAIPDKSDSLSSVVNRIEYGVRAVLDDALIETLRSIMERDSITVTRETKKGTKTIDIRPGILSLEPAADDSGFVMLVSVIPLPVPWVRPRETIPTLW